MEKQRLDQEIVARGLAPTRAKAQAAIAAGKVFVNGEVARRASALVAPGDAIEAAAAHPWVSRGGVKLAHALNAFVIDPAARICLDLGASTGGFAQVLLARGAARVYAVDVGRGQVHPDVAALPGLVSLEETDARRLTTAMIPEPPSLIVADLSFISLEKALPPALALAAAAADLVALIKPQFEAGPGRAPGWEEAQGVAQEVAARLDGLGGFYRQALIDSPIAGGGGAREFLFYARRQADQ